MKTIRIVGLVLAASCFAACAGKKAPVAEADPAPAVEPAPGTVVSLRFGWPVGLTANVESEGDIARSGQKPVRVKLRSRLMVREAPDGLLIEETVDTFGGGGLIESLASLSPGFVVGAEGEFLRVVHLEEFRAQAMDLIMSLMQGQEGPNHEAARAQAQALLDQVFTEQVLASQVADAWNSRVAAWSGADMTFGEPLSLVTEAEHPMLESGGLELEVVFAWVGEATCSRDGERRCVELTIESRPTERGAAALVEATRKMVAQLAPGSEAELADVSVSIENRVRLLCEPDTLITHRFERWRDERIETGGGAERQVRFNRNHVVEVFDYD